VKVYADTSFFISWLYVRDVHHADAQRWYSVHPNEEWIVSPWSEFETVNTIRSLCTRSPGPSREYAEGLRRFFKRLFVEGPLERLEVDWDVVLRDAAQISAAHAAAMHVRSADVLHVAIMEQLNPDLFVSGDTDQVDLASARGFRSENFH
jgi:predicted nucleic acid-binding protein